MKYLVGILALIVVGGAIYTLLPENHEHYDEHDHEHSEPITAKEPVRADGTFTIAVSFYPLQFAVEQIVGELGIVTNIGDGIDPHDFEPTTQDILSLQQADLVVLQGAEFEPWGDDVITQLQSDDVPVVLATAEIELHEGGHDHDEHEHDEEAEEEHEDEHEEEGHEHEHGAYDPHTWLDPVLFSEMVEHIGEAIIILDPENSAIYEANIEALQSELTDLNATFESRLSNCALDEVITSHDAFSYLAERYGFTIHSIAGLSTQDTPSVTVVAELKEEAEEGIGAILLEENSVAAYGETLARETGLQTLSINPVAYIIPTGQNYLTLMQTNLDTFATALQCE